MRIVLLALGAWLLATAASPAAQMAAFSNARGTATLIAQADSVAPGQAVTVGLRLALAPGWHTYGRDPGDAGEPPELDWTLPPGVAAGPVAWPPAHRQVEGPLVTYGYTGTVVLPVTLSGASGTLPIGLHARWLVCSNICVPEEARFSLTLPPGDGRPGRDAAWFAAPAVASAPVSASAGWVEALVLALLGGVLLNLMPCVFPVLAVKAAGLARLRGAAQRERLALACAYASGVVLAFGGIGAALLALRSGGALVGWGFQFAHPGFVAATAWILLAIGLNFSGVFEADLPGLAGRGQRWAGRGGVGGSFATGLLAVLAASPCTTPFMGTALVAASTAPLAASLGIFVALGVGLAAPYVVLAAVPAFSRLLPRPGAWMVVLRGVLAFPMYGAASWLLWVLAREAGADGVRIGVLGACLVGFCAWLLGLSQRAGRPRSAWRIVTLAAGAAAVLVLLWLPRGLAPSPPDRPGDAAGEAFSVARLAELRAQGRPVFVDMTASWCVTCLVNERVALDRAPVRAAFHDAGVALLRGDWTRQDPELTAFLHDHGSEGVPLYLLYPADGRAPVQLPQLLTEGTVLEALRRPG